MTQTTHLSCTCGQTRLTVEGTPIVAAECCCTSCRTAGGRLEALPGAPKIVEPNGATQLILYRKDRVHFDGGTELLREHRLAPQSATRRVVAICCNTPMFLEFTKGHWLSLYGYLWSPEARPRIEMRTMTSDALPGANLSNDIPNPKRQTFSFFVKLLSAWLAMGFSVPKIAFVQGKIDDPAG